VCRGYSKALVTVHRTSSMQLQPLPRYFLPYFSIPVGNSEDRYNKKFWLVESSKLLLALASKVILGSESRGTHNHILLSHDSESCPKKFWEELIVYFPFIRHEHIENEKIKGGTKTHREQGDLISLLTNIRRDTQTAMRSHKPSFISSK
jgi:hypothetical protein